MDLVFKTNLARDPEAGKGCVMVEVKDCVYGSSCYLSNFPFLRVFSLE